MDALANWSGSILGSARVPRAGEGVPPSRTFLVVCKQKFVSAEHRNEHSARVRSPEDCCDGRLVTYSRCHGCVTFCILGLQTSFTNTKAKEFASGRLNLYVPGPLQFLGTFPD